MTKPVERYIPSRIEKKWQDRWAADGLYHADIDNNRKKFYALTMLPYPSGNLHIGHWYAMTPSDARARFKRMVGYNVMFPMGFDAFGLPAENAAIQHNIHPKEWTYNNIAHMREQLRSMGAMFDWRREAISSDPKYYRWTQWFFIQLFKHKLAYRKMAPVVIIGPWSDHRPGITWQPVVTRRSGSTMGDVAVTPTIVAVPNDTIIESSFTAPAPNRQQFWSKPPSITGVPSASPVWAAAARVTVPATRPDSPTTGSFAGDSPSDSRIGSDQASFSTSSIRVRWALDRSIVTHAVAAESCAKSCRSGL